MTIEERSPTAQAWERSTRLLADAGEVADRSTAIWDAIDRALRPIIGQRGFNALNQRSKSEIMKMRGQPRLPGLHSSRIKSGGIEVFAPAGAVAAEQAATQAAAGSRASMGVPALGVMMGIGLPRDYSLLVAGPRHGLPDRRHHRAALHRGGRRLRRMMAVVKMRASAHSDELRIYSISDDGFRVEQATYGA